MVGAEDTVMITRMGKIAQVIRKVIIVGHLTEVRSASLVNPADSSRGVLTVIHLCIPACTVLS